MGEPVRVSFYLSGNPVHDRVVKALYDGCPEEKTLIEGFRYVPADVGVVFGVYKSRVPVSWPRGEVFRKHRADGADVVVLETGYINRGDGDYHHYAAGFNGLNGRADFKNKKSSAARLSLLDVKIKPWHSGENVILCRQVPWDASVDHIDFNRWAEQAYDGLKMCGWNVIVKEHPCIDKNSPPLSELLPNAHAVVTFNSNSAVEAAIDGVPVFAFDEGSMAWEIANKDFRKLPNPDKPDRTQWLQDLAYCQWTPEEMSKGLTWSHLFEPRR